MRRVTLQYVAAWFPMLAIAIVNGTLRELAYAPYMSELRAHQLSTLTAIVLFGFYIGWIVRRRPLPSGRAALAVGLVWLVMTVAFEFLFGRYVAGRPRAALLANYDLSAGRVWALLVVWIALAPYCFFRLGRRGT